MEKFTCVKDAGNLESLLAEALEVKASPFFNRFMGENRTIGLVFFNPSLRTRLSSQRAAQNLGMNAIVLNIDKEGWKIETGTGVIMDGDKAEHIREAAPVIGQYCDMLGVRSFAGLDDRDKDYADEILDQFTEYSGVPVVSLESATRHPLQSFADLITIHEHKKTERPKVVLTWAPHPKALPQAVANSFAEWMNAADVDLHITHPKGYELSEDFTKGAGIEYDQRKAFEGADFIYAKNWASYTDYGQVLSTDRSWTVDSEKMELTNQAKFMHCLPVRRNMVVSDEVIESPASLVIPQAANRVVSAQTVFRSILKQINM